MAEIAEEAGVTRAVLYDHFDSKRDLFIAALNEQSSIFLGHVGAHIGGDGTARERMRATVDAVFSFAERHPQAWQLIHTIDVHGDHEIDMAWQESRRVRAGMVTRMLASDLEYAGIDPDGRRADLMVEMLIGALAAGAMEWLREHRETTRDEVVDIAMGLLWTGMSRPS
jgi:AcrR family transcriptional regulator